MKFRSDRFGLVFAAVGALALASCGGGSHSGILPGQVSHTSKDAANFGGLSDDQRFTASGSAIQGALFYDYGGEGGSVTSGMSLGTSAPSTSSISVPRAPFVDSWGWISDQSVGTASWPAATYTVSLNVTNPNSAVRIVAVKVYRVDENGGPSTSGLAVVGRLTGLSASLAQSGVQTFTVQGATQNANPSDRLAVKFYTATESNSSQTFSYAVGDGSQSSVKVDTSASPQPIAAPAISHITMVILENHDYADIIGSSDAPFLNSLANGGALFTDSHAVTHPSQPNYLALFSGSTQGVTDDSCPQSFDEQNLASELQAAGYSFTGYAEDLPADPLSCQAGSYWRKHVPWTDFDNVPAAETQAYAGPLSALPSNVSIIVPDICDDMHDCSVATGDRWLAQNLPAIQSFDNANNGLLIVTFDEGHTTPDNHIATILSGPMVVPGQYGQRITHYDVLRTIENNFGLAPLGESADATGVQGVFRY